MKISPEEVAKVASLSRLDLPEDKLELFAGQLGDILAYMDKLGELDTDAVEPLYSPVKHTTVLRRDEVRKDYRREEILANAPEQDGQFFIVPRIV
ncbi:MULTISPECIES: Asp-tRNA(Asn)/Glu-tRNA(Gln) amidotransferase subunit GatC [Pseudodesulfovibrio]|jgi:aspartyl-tRNA(Asn)/glutamyl-tRNA(Gln) amidotransferase subunit C|uniref:Aspartyl/glutamyl-tRNA(Asn/Gln) amidotransferase subunit C n=3 Tax=Pseudodesulfovibrio TaxID=2035811 RepID=A0A1J5NHJ4_9BACT|nr:Asp-tRNA(Asn)/Glu-tRNA(Gln) amidotransferase subunit GatC [Pseudodesulfovibrio hydrargyri]OIQ51169.1 Glutamyl-tRNA(Gln) amidotransferase subunit C [Pseudodesulfovibrio hydrargyri]